MKIVLASDSEYFNQLIPVIQDASRGGRGSHLLHSFGCYSDDREAEIERICNTNHQEFVTSVNQLLHVRQGTVTLTSEVLELNKSIQSSTEKFAEQKKALVESRGVRQNIDEATNALQNCLDVLQLANQVHDLLGKKKHYSALRALDELQNVHLKEITQYGIAEIIQKSVPMTKKLIAEAVMTDLSTWLFRIREISQFLGEVAFYHTEQRRTRQKDRADTAAYLANFKLNSAIELVSDENEDFDILDNEDLQVDFTPLFECIHIHHALGQMEKFRAEYAATRRQQKELLMPSSITLIDTQAANLSELLEGIAGFAIVEKATMRKAPELRSTLNVGSVVGDVWKASTEPPQVDELWNSMCQSAITLISKALPEVVNAEVLLKIKGVVTLFIQTMEVGEFWSSGFWVVLWLKFCSRGTIQSARLTLSCWFFSISMRNS